MVTQWQIIQSMLKVQLNTYVIIHGNDLKLLEIMKIILSKFNWVTNSLVDASILGKEVNVTGKLLPVKMDDKMVLMWETQMKGNHKGEEDTEHFKEELAYIQNVYRQIVTGEIPYYTTYTIEAESYELE